MVRFVKHDGGPDKAVEQEPDKAVEQERVRREAAGSPDAGPETSPNWLFERAVAREPLVRALSSKSATEPDRSISESVHSLPNRPVVGRGQRFARGFPSKEAMYDGGAEALLEGFRPAAPLIHMDTRVVAMGSCFAALFIQWLSENGFNRHVQADPESSFVWSSLETPVVVAQQFRWAFGEFDPDLAFWFGPDRKRYAATEERRLDLRTTLAEAEVVILTLGLAEAWYDSESGEAIWRVPPRELLDRYRFRVTSVSESVAALETIDRLRREHMPHAKVIYTVSPIRFGATFRPMSPVVANVASKAIVRASIDEFFSNHQPLVLDVYHYFPSYEIVTQLLVDPFSPGDNRHLHRHHENAVIDLFARHYTTIESRSLRHPFPASALEELRTTIETLERANGELRTACEERRKVIETLDRANGELRTACEERRKVIHKLDAALQRLGRARERRPLLFRSGGAGSNRTS
jgi:GSCFA family